MFPQNQNNKYLDDIYKAAQPAASSSQPFQATGGASPFTPATNYNFNPYQVQTGDTFQSIAEKNNLNEQAVQTANNGMLVPPPKGSYINIPRPGFANAPQNPQGYNVQQRGRGYNSYYGPQSQQPATPTNNIQPGRPDFSQNWQILQDLRSNIASGTAPTSVPNSMLAGVGATPESMQAAGYVFNQATGTWTLKGASTATATGAAIPQSGNNWQTNPALRQIIFNRNAKNPKSRFQTNLKWAINAWRRKAGKGKNRPATQVPPSEGPNVAGGSPTNTLELHLGSG